MRLKIAIRITKIGLLFCGSSLLAVSLLAVQLGLDHDSRWGVGRILMAVTGSLSLLGALFLHARCEIRNGLGKIRNSLSSQKFSSAGQRIFQPARTAYPVRIVEKTTKNLSNRIAHFPPIAYFRFSSQRSAMLFSGLGIAVTILIYLFYITSGTLNVWTPYSSTFNRLSDAFLAGKLYLLESPPAQLLALQNPYDWHTRQGIGYLWDASLYHGKYYYYWGPGPALLLVVLKAVLGSYRSIDDQFLVFFFCSGLVVILSLLLVQLRKHFFPDAPARTLLPFTLVAGLAAPVFWLINRPSVYETAIAGGQFFLFIGIYAVIRCLTQNRVSRGWMLLAGISFGAAVNCRLSLAPAVIFFAVVTAWVSIQNSKDRLQAILHLSFLGLPLVLSAVGMGWYNAARFGSILETGHRYQLTGMALPPNYRDVTSVSYLLPSLYSYLFRPLQFSWQDFPYIFAPFIKENMWPWFMRIPKYYYYAEPVAGVLMLVPSVWLIFLPLSGWVKRGWLWLNEKKAFPNDFNPPVWVWVFFVGGVFLLFAPLLVFISTSMRYLADITPILSILSALGFWWAVRFHRASPNLLRWLAWVTAILVLMTLVISLLVNFTNGDKRFATNNPALYHTLANFLH